MSASSARTPLLVVLLSLLGANCLAGILVIPAPVQDRATTPLSIQRDIPSIHETLSQYFSVGAAIALPDITGVHSELLKKHFNSVTAENAMKWGSLEPAEGKIDCSIADALVGFAVANHFRVRGHTLVWHKQIPAWVFKDANGKDLLPTPENKTLLLRRLDRHIREVVSHFNEQVYAWDVVNEVIDPNQPDGFRRSPWFQITGTDYIDEAFRVAHEVAPSAKLFINDYDTTNPKKRAFLYKLVRDLQSRGVPINGIGHQMHSNIATPSAEALVETVNGFSALGLDNQITELDISVYTDAKSRYLDIADELLIRQGYRYRDLFQAFRELKGKISSVTFWGMADDHTWLKHFPITRRDLPLPFDEQLQAKYAYWGIVDPSKLPKELPSRRPSP